jgi:hypothetical protein
MLDGRQYLLAATGDTLWSVMSDKFCKTLSHANVILILSQLSFALILGSLGQRRGWSRPSAASSLQSLDWLRRWPYR